MFESVDTLREGLQTMRQFYEDDMSDDGTSLRHALLGRDIGGGIAFVDAVCDSTWGVGLSSGLRGKIDNLDEDAMYDVFMFSHEIGHSFGSGTSRLRATQLAFFVDFR